MPRCVGWGERRCVRGHRHERESFAARTCHREATVCDTAYDSPALRLLNRADMQTNELGDRVSMEVRLTEIEGLYDPGSLQHQNARRLAESLGLVTGVPQKGGVA